MTPNTRFQPVSKFDCDINRSERTRQVRFLVPLLALADSRAWFLNRLDCPCPPAEARRAQVFHFCYPLADVFYSDFRQCRGTPHLEDQFISHYNDLFQLGDGFDWQYGVLPQEARSVTKQVEGAQAGTMAS